MSGVLNLLTSDNASAPAGPYSGPGDVISSAICWHGLRAYSLATCGNNCVDIIRASDSTTNTFNTLANGNLDVASIATFLASTTGKITKLYDQTGNGLHLLQATDGQRPAFTLNGLGSLPVMTYNGTANQVLASSAAHSAFSQPFCANVFGRRTGNTTAYSGAMHYNSTAIIMEWTNSANTMLAYAGSSITGTAADSSPHAFSALFQNTTGKFSVDGAATASGTVGTASISADSLSFGLGANNNPLTGYICESGWWPTDVSASFAALSTNQHAYWG